MKSLIIILFQLLVSQSLFANCFKFVNGKGPRIVGNVLFSPNQRPGAQFYTAKEICIKQVNRLSGGSYTSVELNDEEGKLMGFAARVSNGLCGIEYCKQFQALSGSAMGHNLTADQISKVNLTIEAQRNHLGLSGTLTDNMSGQKYVLVNHK
jgi:hypothetical protein